MDEQLVVEEQPKRKVEKSCGMCFHCRVRVKANLKDILATVITPKCIREGLVYIYCRMNYWHPKIGISKLLFNIKQASEIRAVCPYWTGEEDEEDNSALAL